MDGAVEELVGGVQTLALLSADGELGAYFTELLFCSTCLGVAALRTAPSRPPVSDDTVQL